MDSYLEFILLPDPEIATTVLMSELFGHIHLALVEKGEGQVGVSFPLVKQAGGLGGVLRLHGESPRLSVIKKALRLGALVGYLEVVGPRDVPENVSHRVVRRVQAKSNPARLRRRLMRRHGMTLEQATKQIPDEAKKTLKLPFINLKSASTGRLFPLFIKHEENQAEPSLGQFSTYGLSTSGTVPWF